MDASTLESLIRSLEIRSQSLGSWLEFWIVCVVVGLLVECPVVVAEHFHKFGPPTRKNLCIKLIGPILIAAGVAGEFGVTLKAGKVETDLRNANRLLVGLVNEQTGKANERAGKANERAGAAEDRAAQANKKANAFRLQIARANERAANAENETAKLTKTTEEERLARVRIEQRMADRDITLEQRERMLRVLRTRAPGHITVQSLLSEGREGLQYALRIADVFRLAGWDVANPNGRGSFEIPLSGVVIVAGADSQELTDFIVSVLLAGGICDAPAGVSQSHNTPPKSVEIWVLSKNPYKSK